jgi:hypothetical protein
MTRRVLIAFGLALAVGLQLEHALAALRSAGRGAELPARLMMATSADVDRLSNRAVSSAPTPHRTSWDSNVIPDLVIRRVRAGRTGVGPGRSSPGASPCGRRSRSPDIRRGEHARAADIGRSFWLSKDRADFLSMLFSKPRPPGLGARSTAVELFSAFGASPASDALYQQTLATIQNHLTKTHGLALSPDDLAGIEYVHHTFYRNGFAVRPSPTYAELMTQTDGAGTNRSYLATKTASSFSRSSSPKTSSFPSSETSADPRQFARLERT